MLTSRLDELAGILDAELCGPGDRTVAGGCTDSRRVGAGEVYFALPGERFDGHAFVTAAFEAGAGAAVVARERRAEIGAAGPLLWVDDPLKALAAWAAAHRRQSAVRVIGVTGSLGKTTTKDLLAAVLSRRYRVLANVASFNAEIGLPLTLLRLTAEHEVAVLEMAMRGAGQIRALAEIAAPEIGLITNIGVSHMELLGSQAAIAAAKAELIEALPPEGTAILPADDPFLPFLRERAPEAVTFGLSATADARVEPLPPGDGGARLRLHAPRWLAEPLEIELPLPGRHNALNAAAAALGGLLLGLSAEEIAAGLASAAVSPMRMQIHRRADGVVILDDAYNASSPAAMRAALETLAEERRGRRAIAVLGDMLELGELSPAAHREVGEVVAALPPDLLVTVGPRAAEIGAVAREAGLEAVIVCETVEAGLRALESRIQAGDLILVKGSRGMAMERLVQGLLACS